MIFKPLYPYWYWLSLTQAPRNHNVHKKFSKRVETILSSCEILQVWLFHQFNIIWVWIMWNNALRKLKKIYLHFKKPTIFFEIWRTILLSQKCSTHIRMVLTQNCIFHIWSFYIVQTPAIYAFEQTKWVTHMLGTHFGSTCLYL